jgi:large subunit ribosomal protein L9e
VILTLLVLQYQGYEYKMRFVYAHFPVNAIISDDNRQIQIKNFLGEKITRTINLLDGVTITRSENVKDEIVLVGNNIENVSQSGMLAIN